MSESITEIDPVVDPASGTAGRDGHRMPCSEVWGGNRDVDQGVVTAGLDVWVWSRPARGARRGGDIHYVSSCASGRITRMLVADVSGHGDVVAEEAERLRDLMRRFVNFIDPRRFVRAMNRRFLTFAGERFATAAVATYFAPRRELSFCIAGHPAPLVRAGGEGWRHTDRPEPGDGMRGLPIGVVEDVRYDQVVLEFTAGDLAVVVSDGVLEARDAAGEQFGTARLVATLEAMDRDAPPDAERVPADVADAIRTALERWTDGAEFHEDDDVTVLVFRGNDVPSTVFDTLTAPFRVLGNYVSTRRFGDLGG